MNIKDIDIKKVETLVNRDLNKRYFDPNHKKNILNYVLKIYDFKDEEEIAQKIYEEYFNNKEKVFDCELSRLREHILIEYKEGV